MAKETVEYIDGTTVELEVYHLGYRKASQIAIKNFPIDKMTRSENGDESMSGKFSPAEAQLEAIETIKGIDIDKLKGEEAARLYKEYFQKEVMSAVGQGGNPN